MDQETVQMKPMAKDFAVVVGLAAAVVISLLLVRVTDTDPEPTPSSAPVTTAESAAPIALPGTSALVPTAASLPTAVVTTSSAPARQSTLATMVLSIGAPVNPRVDRTPRTARLASTPPSLAGALTPPPDNPDPQVFRDPAAVATAWLSALCFYDYRAGRDDNTRRAALYGSIDMPPNQNPWTLNDSAWAQITAAQTSSGCTDISASTETLTHDGSNETAVNLGATQILSAAGTPYQATRITVSRFIQSDAQGNWQVGRPVTAN